jgi:hypothetical protein
MNQNTWHFDQLKKELEDKSRSETDRIDLINPETNKKLDQKLWNDFWIPIKRTVENSRFCVMEKCQNSKKKIVFVSLRYSRMNCCLLASVCKELKNRTDK